MRAKTQKKGKRRQNFTQREVQRALRADQAEHANRIIRITRDGAIELVPVGDAADRERDETHQLDDWLKGKNARQA